MRKLLCTLLSLLLMVGAMVPAKAEENSIKVVLDGRQLSFDVEPMLIGGRTMVPLRAIFEALGATVLWDETTKTVSAYNEAYYVKATIDKQDMYVNGQVRKMDIAPMIIDERTLVPARFVAEAFNCQVDWNGDNKTVSILSREIDYNNLEQKNDETTKIEKEPDVQKEKVEKTTTYSKYYPGTNVPDYTAVTGVELKDIYQNDESVIYQYRHTESGKYSEVVDYMGYLIESCGWSSLKTDDKDGHITWYYSKGTDLIGVAYYAQYNEIWIAIPN